MNDAGLMTVILLVGVLAGAAAQWLIDRVILVLEEVKKGMADNRLFKAKRKIVDEMRANGDFHEWVTIQSTQGELMVCKKTGWCPSLKGFVDTNRIESYLYNLKYEADYKVFRAERVGILAKRLSLTDEEVEKVVEEVFSIKKDFALIRLEDLKNELKQRAQLDDTK
jgi:hypothetical protein